MKNICILVLLGALASSVQAQPSTFRWVYDAGAVIRGSPAIGSDGTVYVGVGGDLYAVTNAGTVVSNKWVAAGVGGNSPAIATDGTIYCSGNRASAVGVNGSPVWSCWIAGGGGSPALGADSSMYANGFSFIYSISRGGTTNWQRIIGTDAEFAAPVIGPDGTVYSHGSGGLAAFTAAGTAKWQAAFGSTGHLPGESAAISADGTICLFGGDGLYAFAPDGTRLWFNGGIPGGGSSAAIAADGTVYVGSIYGSLVGYGFSLYALTAAGTIKWQVTTNLGGTYGAVLGTPAVDSAGSIYYAAYTRLYAFSAAGQVKWTFDCGSNPGDQGSYSYTSPTIGPDGTIYATFGSRLYAFAGTNGLADSPWPMYRQNARHTGKVEKPSLQKPQKRSDANFQFELYAQVEQPYTIEASTNLNTWTSLTSFVATTLPTEVFDLNATNFPARFYRAVSDSPAPSR